MSPTTTIERLAVLIGAPWPGDVAMHNDVAAMYASLRAGGLPPEDILCLEGGLRRELILAFLRGVRARFPQTGPGEVLLYFSGHGGFWPWTAADAAHARPALLPEKGTEARCGRWLPWDLAWRALLPPPNVQVTLLPDC